MTNFDERDLLARELRHRSEDVGGHPISLDTVRSGARRVQRRRNAVRGAVAAVIAAITVPAAFALNSSLTTAEGPDQDPTFAASPSTTPAPRPPGPVRLSLEGLERGENSAVDLLVGNELLRSDGSVVELPGAYQEIAPYDGGWVGLVSVEGNYSRDFIDADGDVTSSVPASYGLAVNRDGTQVAYTEAENGRLTIVDAPVDGGDPRTISVPQDGEVRAAGYVPDGALVYQRGEQVRVFERDAKDFQVPGLLSVDGVSAATGLISGMTEARIDGSCNAVVDYRSGDPTATTCEHSFGRFSPDGRLVVGTDAYGDGLGNRSLAMIDALNGDVLVQFEQAGDSQLVLGEMVWEDGEHVLAPVGEGRDWQIVRFGLDGSMEVASDTVATPEYEEPSPIRFVGQP